MTNFRRRYQIPVHFSAAKARLSARTGAVILVWEGLGLSSKICGRETPLAALFLVGLLLRLIDGEHDACAGAASASVPGGSFCRHAIGNRQ